MNDTWLAVWVITLVAIVALIVTTCGGCACARAAPEQSYESTLTVREWRDGEWKTVSGTKTTLEDSRCD